MFLAVVQSRGGISIGHRYRLIAELGQGPGGTVWQAHDDHLGRDVAIRKLHSPADTAVGEPAYIDRLLRDAHALTRLGHRSIAGVHDVVIEQGRPWIVTELRTMPDLGRLIAQRGRLRPDQVGDIARRLLDALDTAHNAGIVHRDIKPGNVLVADNGRVLLTDFALPGFGVTSIPHAAEGGPNGGPRSPGYVAPEVAQGGVATPAADLWCLGATLYAAVEGHSPYDRRGLAITRKALLTTQPRPPRRAGSLTPLIMGLLEPDPARRLGVADALDRLERPPARAGRRQSGRHRLLIAVSLIVATAIIGVVGLGGLMLGMAREQPGDRPGTDPGRPDARTPAETGEPIAAPEGAATNALVVRGIGDNCRIFVARPGTTEVIFDGVLGRGQVGKYDLPRLDLVVQDAASCDVWINGWRQPTGRPGERKRYTVAEQ